MLMSLINWSISMSNYKTKSALCQLDQTQSLPSTPIKMVVKGMVSMVYLQAAKKIWIVGKDLQERGNPHQIKVETPSWQREEVSYYCMAYQN